MLCLDREECERERERGGGGGGRGIRMEEV